MLIDDLKRLAQKNPDVVVGAVDRIEEALIGENASPEVEPASSVLGATSPPAQTYVCLENLYAVVGAVGDIHQAVF